MTILIKNGQVYKNGKLRQMDCIIDDEGILTVAERIDLEKEDVDEWIDATDYLITSGLVEAWSCCSSGQLRQEATVFYAGGFTSVLNYDGKTISYDNLKTTQQDLQNIPLQVISHANIEADSEALNKDCFSYVFDVAKSDVSLFEDEAKFLTLLQQLQAKNAVVILDCSSCDKETEIKWIQTFLNWAQKVKIQLHVHGIMSKEAVELIRHAKQEGIEVSCDIHILNLLYSTEKMMDVPILLGEESDRQALLQGVKDKTVEMISTGHSLEKTGVATARFALGLAYNDLVKTRKLSLEQLWDCMSFNIGNIFGLPLGEIENFETANMAIFDLRSNERITPQEVSSSNHAQCLIGKYRSAVCVCTICDGRIVYRNGI